MPLNKRKRETRTRITETLVLRLVSNSASEFINMIKTLTPIWSQTYIYKALSQTRNQVLKIWNWEICHVGSYWECQLFCSDFFWMIQHMRWWLSMTRRVVVL